MTKKLNWRLKDLPDATDVAELVDKKVITPDEARELLFSDKPDEAKKLKELEEEVKFLRDLCDKLAAKSNGWTTIIKEVERYRPHYPVWYSTYSHLSVPQTVTYGGAVGSSTLGALNGMTMNTAQTPKMLGKLN